MDAPNYKTPSIEDAYDRHADMLFRIAYSVVLSKEDAEDAIQEVFAKYVKNAPAFREREHEKAWFVRVTINQCRDTQRRRAIRSYTPLDEIIETPVADNKSASVLEQVLLLPSKYKTAIILYYFEDFSVENIAKALRITKSAVKMRLARGREYQKNEITKGE